LRDLGYFNNNINSANNENRMQELNSSKDRNVGNGLKKNYTQKINQ